MRVLIITNLYPSSHQPHRAAFNRQQFGALARSGEHQVRVIAPVAWTRAWTSPTGPARPQDGLSRVDDGVAVLHPRYLFTPKVLRGCYGHFLTRSIRRCFHESVRVFRPDVVLGSWAYPDGWAAVKLAREAGLPVAVKVHGSDLLTLHDHPSGAARSRRTAETLAGADAVIAVSQHLRQRALSMGADPHRTHIVHNGIDTATFSPGPRDAARFRLGVSSPEPLILFVGNLVPVKGLDVLLDALASLTRSGVAYQCACIGEGPLKAHLTARVRSLELSSRVHLLGGRSHDELPDWYRAASLVVLPSRSEGIPNVLLEAAACSTPIVASQVGGIPEIVPAESMVPAGDPAALADRIARFLDPSGRPAPGVFAPGSWNDSARALAVVLGSIAASVAAHRSVAA